MIILIIIVRIYVNKNIWKNMKSHGIYLKLMDKPLKFYLMHLLIEILMTIMWHIKEDNIKTIVKTNLLISLHLKME